MNNNKNGIIHGTTIICTKDHKGNVAIAADGQATMGDCVVKGNIKKIKKLFDGTVLVGFAGSTADAYALLKLFEAKMEKTNDITNACLAVADEWRTNKMYRSLQASLIVADKSRILIVTGNGDVMEPEDNIAAIGSGGFYALSACRAFKKCDPPSSNDKTYAEFWVRESLKIASEICIYTNSNIISEVIYHDTE